MKDEVQQMIRSGLIPVRGDSCQRAKNPFSECPCIHPSSVSSNHPPWNTTNRERKDSIPLSRLPLRVFSNWPYPTASIFPLSHNPPPHDWNQYNSLHPSPLQHIPLRSSFPMYTIVVFRFAGDRVSMTSWRHGSRREYTSVSGQNTVWVIRTGLQPDRRECLLDYEGIGAVIFSILWSVAVSFVLFFLALRSKCKDWIFRRVGNRGNEV